MNEVTTHRPPLRATVSGSFKRHLRDVQVSVERLQANGVLVLSPAEPTVVDQFGDFVFVSSDRRRSIKGIQNRHLAAIQRSDFLWLCCADGYVGQSAAMEIGFAVANGVPVYADAAPSDLTLRQYVCPAGTVDSAVALVPAASRRSEISEPSLLVAPEKTLSLVQEELDTIETSLGDWTPRLDDPVERAAATARGLLSLHSTR